MLRRLVPLVLALSGCARGQDPGEPAPGFARVQAIIDRKDRNDPIPRLRLAAHGPTRGDKVVRPARDWERRLSPGGYAVLRGQGTERPDSSPFVRSNAAGIYRCAGCGLPIFGSDAKYSLDTGWPSFVRPVRPDAVWYRLDRAGGRHRVEVLCARCDGHLGHVFDDGPTARGGLRYCINGVAMAFRPAASPAR